LKSFDEVEFYSELFSIGAFKNHSTCLNEQGMM